MGSGVTSLAEQTSIPAVAGVGSGVVADPPQGSDASVHPGQPAVQQLHAKLAALDPPSRLPTLGSSDLALVVPDSAHPAISAASASVAAGDSATASKEACSAMPTSTGCSTQQHGSKGQCSSQQALLSHSSCSSGEFTRADSASEHDQMQQSAMASDAAGGDASRGQAASSQTGQAAGGPGKLQSRLSVQLPPSPELHEGLSSSSNTSSISSDPWRGLTRQQSGQGQQQQRQGQLSLHHELSLSGMAGLLPSTSPASARRSTPTADSASEQEYDMQWAGNSPATTAAAPEGALSALVPSGVSATGPQVLGIQHDQQEQQQHAARPQWPPPDGRSSSSDGITARRPAGQGLRCQVPRRVSFGAPCSPSGRQQQQLQGSDQQAGRPSLAELPEHAELDDASMSHTPTDLSSLSPVMTPPTHAAGMPRSSGSRRVSDGSSPNLSAAAGGAGSSVSPTGPALAEMSSLYSPSSAAFWSTEHRASFGSERGSNSGRLVPVSPGCSARAPSRRPSRLLLSPGQGLYMSIPKGSPRRGSLSRSGSRVFDPQLTPTGSSVPTCKDASGKLRHLPTPRPSTSREAGSPWTGYAPWQMGGGGSSSSNTVAAAAAKLLVMQADDTADSSMEGERAQQQQQAGWSPEALLQQQQQQQLRRRSGGHCCPEDEQQQQQQQQQLRTSTDNQLLHEQLLQRLGEEAQKQQQQQQEQQQRQDELEMQQEGSEQPLMIERELSLGMPSLQLSVSASGAPSLAAAMSDGAADNLMSGLASPMNSLSDTGTPGSEEEDWWRTEWTGMAVRDVMSQGVMFVGQDAGAATACALMAEKGLPVLLVDCGPGKEPGYITRRDLFKIPLKKKPRKKLLVRDLMRHPMVCVPADQAIEEAAVFLQEQQVERAVVVDTHWAAQQQQGQGQGVGDGVSQAEQQPAHMAQYVGLVSDVAIYKCLGLDPESDPQQDDMDESVLRMSARLCSTSSTPAPGAAPGNKGSDADTPAGSLGNTPDGKHAGSGAEAAAGGEPGLSRAGSGGSASSGGGVLGTPLAPRLQVSFGPGLEDGTLALTPSFGDKQQAQQQRMSAASSMASAGPASSSGAGALFKEDSEGYGDAPDTLQRLRTAAALWELDYEEIQPLRKIGEGSFGEVELGLFRGTKVAVKRLRTLDIDSSSAHGDDYPSTAQQRCPEEATRSQAAFKQFFEREIAILASIRHPNVVNFIGACHRPPNRCLVTEYCARGSLDQLLHKSGLPLDLPKRVEFAMDIVRGMLCLHSQRPAIIHRDLKTANLLVSGRWEVKVADFGLSRIKDASQLQVSRAGLEGTVEYCAPEVLRGESYSETCDVWSFGVVLWELLTRQRPYSDSDIPIFLMVVNIGNGGLTLPPVDPEQATPGLVELLGTCLRFEPGDRPSFQEVLKVLEGEYRILRSRPGAVPGVRLWSATPGSSKPPSPTGSVASGLRREGSGSGGVAEAARQQQQQQLMGPPHQVLSFQQHLQQQLAAQEQPGLQRPPLHGAASAAAAPAGGEAHHVCTHPHHHAHHTTADNLDAYAAAAHAAPTAAMVGAAVATMFSSFSREMQQHSQQQQQQQQQQLEEAQQQHPQQPAWVGALTGWGSATSAATSSAASGEAGAGWPLPAGPSLPTTPVPPAGPPSRVAAPPGSAAAGAAGSHSASRPSSVSRHRKLSRARSLPGPASSAWVDDDDGMDVLQGFAGLQLDQQPQPQPSHQQYQSSAAAGGYARDRSVAGQHGADHASGPSQPQQQERGRSTQARQGPVVSPFSSQAEGGCSHGPHQAVPPSSGHPGHQRSMASLRSEASHTATPFSNFMGPYPPPAPPTAAAAAAPVPVPSISTVGSGGSSSSSRWQEPHLPGHPQHPQLGGSPGTTGALSSSPGGTMMLWAIAGAAAAAAASTAGRRPSTAGGSSSMHPAGGGHLSRSGSATSIASSLSPSISPAPSAGLPGPAGLQGVGAAGQQAGMAGPPHLPQRHPAMAHLRPRSASGQRSPLRDRSMSPCRTLGDFHPSGQGHTRYPSPGSPALLQRMDSRGPPSGGSSPRCSSALGSHPGADGVTHAGHVRHGSSRLSVQGSHELAPDGSSVFPSGAAAGTGSGVAAAVAPGLAAPPRKHSLLRNDSNNRSASPFAAASQQQGPHQAPGFHGWEPTGVAGAAGATGEPAGEASSGASGAQRRLLPPVAAGGHTPVVAAAGRSSGWASPGAPSPFQAASAAGWGGYVSPFSMAHCDPIEESPRSSSLPGVAGDITSPGASPVQDLRRSRSGGSSPTAAAAAGAAAASQGRGNGQPAAAGSRAYVSPFAQFQE